MTSATKQPRAFTLLELLVVIGIIAVLIGVLLPAAGLVLRKANATRVRADLNTIAQALEAYKADFNGYYPQVIGINPANGKRVDGTGAHVLCQALFGLGPAYPEDGVGADGADGPGFRIRRTIDDGKHTPYTNATPPVALTPSQGDGIPDSFGGKVYGPYLKPENFRFDTETPFTALDTIRVLDHSGSPILYYCASQPNVNLASPTGPLLAWPYDATVPVVATPATKSSATTGNNYRPLFNVLDNNQDRNATPASQIDQTQLLVMLGDYDTDQQINGTEPPANSVPYLLWTRGADGKWGPQNVGTGTASADANRAAAEKCDDITNLR